MQTVSKRLFLYAVAIAFAGISTLRGCDCEEDTLSEVTPWKCATMNGRPLAYDTACLDEEVLGQLSQDGLE